MGKMLLENRLFIIYLQSLKVSPYKSLMAKSERFPTKKESGGQYHIQVIQLGTQTVRYSGFMYVHMQSKWKHMSPL